MRSSVSSIERPDERGMWLSDMPTPYVQDSHPIHGLVLS